MKLSLYGCGGFALLLLLLIITEKVSVAVPGKVPLIFISAIGFFASATCFAVLDARREWQRRHSYLRTLEKGFISAGVFFGLCVVVYSAFVFLL